jgi:hypothetical protein
VQWKARIGLGLVAGLVAMTGASSTQGATSNTDRITIQDATLISPTEILLTGTTTCPAGSTLQAGLTEDNGASGNGAVVQGSTTNWAMTVQGANFVKTKADVVVQSVLCAPGPPTFAAIGERTILVH